MSFEMKAEYICILNSYIACNSPSFSYDESNDVVKSLSV
jgi:hypothetical protein